MKIKNIPLRVVEFLVFGGILFALISPLFSPHEHEHEHGKNSDEGKITIPPLSRGVRGDLKTF